MTKVVERVADALKQSFREAVAATSRMTFEETGVAMPGDAVWDRYAQTAVAATVAELLGRIAAEPVRDDTIMGFDRASDILSEALE